MNYQFENKNKKNQTCKYLYGLEKIPKINKRGAFNKAIGPGKNTKLINIGPRSIPESRVHVFKGSKTSNVQPMIQILNRLYCNRIV